MKRERVVQKKTNKKKIMSEIVISTNNLHKFYGLKDQQVHALRGVDISIKEGEIVGVMGPSGCGKTTLLNCLSGLDSFDEGNILIQGKSLSEQSDDQLSEFRAKKMGFVEYVEAFPTVVSLPTLAFLALKSGVWHISIFHWFSIGFPEKNRKI